MQLVILLTFGEKPTFLNFIAIFDRQIGAAIFLSTVYGIIESNFLKFNDKVNMLPQHFSEAYIGSAFF